MLTKLGAYIREPTARRLPPSRDALLGPGHQLLVTDHGPLDCLGGIEGGLSYDQLLQDAVTVELRGCSLRILKLEKLLELKRQWPDEEARLRAVILERTLKAL